MSDIRETIFEGEDPLNPERRSGEEQAAAVFAEKQAAWAHTLGVRQDAYRRVFAGAGTESDKDLVLNDLRRFCRADESAFHEDERVHVLLTGRQEVWLRIRDHLQLTRDELVLKYSIAPQRGQQ